MDTSLISKFRDKANEYNLICHIYRNCNGKNKWGVICSAMDWIQVGAFGADVSILERNNSDQASVKVITLLSCIDVMWEGIQQLHRVFFDIKSIPFVGQSSIFHKDIEDNSFWKEIRAVFAAHPTNLKVVADGEKRFASWSGGGFGSRGEFAVIIYSNDPSKKPDVFDIYFDEVQSFATSRYEYLNVLMKRLDEIKYQWCKRWQKVPIEMNENTLYDIHTLIKANEERLDNDYFCYRLEEIEKAFSVETHGEKNNRVLDEYRAALKKEVETIRDVLQTMDLGYEPEDADYVDYNYFYQNKLIFEPTNKMLDWAVESLKTPLGQFVDLDFWETIEELQVLVRAGWWKYSQKKAVDDPQPTNEDLRN